MAKKNKGNQIQRRNVTAKVPELHKNNNGATAKKNLSIDEDPQLQNSFNFTMYGMLIGASIGYFAGNLTLGFGIGTLIGGVVDSYFNTQKKKKREAILKEQAEKEQK
jgi:F0F1-type ATP synthase assembly protein I